MQRIPLTQGREALVDDADYDWLNQWKWYLHGKTPAKGYAARAVYTRRPGGGYDKQVIYMHRLIIDASPDCQVDHRNGNRLDNQRSNLRLATYSQNVQNHPKRQTARKSRYKGVEPRKGRWAASITINRTRFFLGYFAREIDAALAYDAKARELHGEFARTNFD